METFMVTFMVERKSKNLCRRTNHRLRKSENQGTDKAPAQRVHGSNYEGLMVGAGLFGVGRKRWHWSKPDCHRPRRRRSALAVMGPARRHDWSALLDPLPLGCHTETRRQRPLRNTARPPEIAGTPAPGSAFMSLFGLRPPLDGGSRCGQCASSD
jgi:hypothetical protein